MDHDYINQFDLIDQYAMGKLAPEEAEEFEEHLVDCLECVEGLKIARSFIQDLRRQTVREALVSRNGISPKARQFWQITAVRFLAAVSYLVLVVGAVIFFPVRWFRHLETEVRQARLDSSDAIQQMHREMEIRAESDKRAQDTELELKQRIEELQIEVIRKGALSQRRPFLSPHQEDPQVNFPIYALVSVERGQTQPPVDIAVPKSSPRFAISVPVEDTGYFKDYRIAIVDIQRATVWEQSGFRPDRYHSLSLSLSSDFLRPGRYDIKVEGLTSASNWTTVGSYPFSIRTGR